MKLDFENYISHEEAIKDSPKKTEEIEVLYYGMFSESKDRRIEVGRFNSDQISIKMFRLDSLGRTVLFDFALSNEGAEILCDLLQIPELGLNKTRINIPEEWLLCKAHLEDGHEIGCGHE